MHRRRPLPVLAATLAAAALLAAGCGGASNANTPNQENTGPPLPSSSGQATIAPSAPTPSDSGP